MQVMRFPNCSVFSVSVFTYFLLNNTTLMGYPFGKKTFEIDENLDGVNQSKKRSFMSNGQGGIGYPSNIFQKTNNMDKYAECKNSNQKPKSTFLWKIATNPVAYLFGTIHVTYTKVWPYIADMVLEGFVRSNSIYFELDLTNSTTVTELTTCQSLPTGEHLADHLNLDLLQRIKQILNNGGQRVRRISMSPFGLASKRATKKKFLIDWQSIRPIWLLFYLNHIAEYGGPLDNQEKPVFDLFLSQVAKSMGKKVRSVEDVRDQCEPLNKISIEQVSAAINVTLSHLENLETGRQIGLDSNRLPSDASEGKFKKSSQFQSSLSTSEYDGHMNPIDKLILNYNCGNIDSMLLNTSLMSNRSIDTTNNERSPESTLQNLDKYLQKELILQRNVKIANGIMRYLQEDLANGRSSFFAIGAAHFLGETGTVIDHLRRHGYTITAVPDDSKATLLDQVGTNEVEHLLRNHLKQDRPPRRTFWATENYNSLLSERDLPKFQPRYVNFKDSWIKIEEFNRVYSQHMPAHPEKRFTYRPLLLVNEKANINTSTVAKSKRNSAFTRFNSCLLGTVLTLCVYGYLSLCYQ